MILPFGISSPDLTSSLEGTPHQSLRPPSLDLIKYVRTFGGYTSHKAEGVFIEALQLTALFQ